MTAFVTIKDIINDSLLDNNDFSNNDFLRAARFVERGIGELKLFHSREYALVKLNIGSDLSAPLPDNFVRYIKVAVLKNGKMVSLTTSFDNIHADNESCSDTTNAEIRYSDTNFRLGHRGGMSFYKECTFNFEKHRIEFSTDLRSYPVYLKYISTGLSQSTLIPVIHREVLIAYVKWKLESTPNLRQLLKQEYYEEVIKLRDAQAYTVDEIYDAVLSTQTITPSR